MHLVRLRVSIMAGMLHYISTEGCWVNGTQALFVLFLRTACECQSLQKDGLIKVLKMEKPGGNSFPLSTLIVTKLS